MIIVDVGCAAYGGDYSIERLIEEFRPSKVRGFDPAARHATYTHGGAEVDVMPWAAWIFDGHVRFHVNGLGGRIDESGEITRCVDLARFILELPEGEPVVLKIDAEGAEYELLEHLIAHGADERLELAWVEWHPWADRDSSRRASLEQRLRCETTEWRW